MTLRKLCLYDLDYTLFETTARIKLFTNGEFERFFYSSVDYYDHLHNHKRDHHEYDFSEYQSADAFRDQAKPIRHIIDNLISDLADPVCDVIILTARTQFDNMDVFKEVFQQHGMNPKQIGFEFAGDVRERFGRENITSPGAKKYIAREYIKYGEYDTVKFYDDLQENLDAVGYLNYEFPDIDFCLYHVDYKNEALTEKTI